MDLNQVTLTVDDMPAAIGFYEALGLRCIVHTHERYARFELPCGSTTLSLHLGDRPKDGGPLLYFETEDVDARFAALSAKGVAFEGAPEDKSWRWREAWFRDPAGNRLCLYHAGPDRRFPPWREEGRRSG
ncbi:VOC family protein [Parvularcula oceani]|uniref:VOC family protein n=1 Tax=Parvularcula oceani TaxID=1247963 RepID=UPI0004E1EC39|nr:VOC family protein [Parvularcula oceani]